MYKGEIKHNLDMKIFMKHLACYPKLNWTSCKH